MPALKILSDKLNITGHKINFFGNIVYLES